MKKTNLHSVQKSMAFAPQTPENDENDKNGRRHPRKSPVCQNPVLATPTLNLVVLAASLLISEAFLGGGPLPSKLGRCFRPEIPRNVLKEKHWKLVGRCGRGVCLTNYEGGTSLEFSTLKVAWSGIFWVLRVFLSWFSFSATCQWAAALFLHSEASYSQLSSFAYSCPRELFGVQLERFWLQGAFCYLCYLQVPEVCQLPDTSTVSGFL